MGVVSVALLGAAAIGLIVAVQKIKWNNYRFKKIHLILMLVSFLCFTAW